MPRWKEAMFALGLLTGGSADAIAKPPNRPTAVDVGKNTQEAEDAGVRKQTEATVESLSKLFKQDDKSQTEVKKRLRARITDLLKKPSLRTAEDKIDAIKDFETAMRERMAAAEKETKPATPDAGTGGKSEVDGVRQLKKTFPDGVSLDAKYLLKSSPDGTRVIIDKADVSGFHPQNYVADGEWGSHFSSVPAEERSVAEGVAWAKIQEIYIIHRVVQSIDAGSPERKGAATYLQQKIKDFESGHRGIKLQFPQ